MTGFDLRRSILDDALAGGQPAFEWDEIRKQFPLSGEPWKVMADWFYERGVAPVPESRHDRAGRAVEFVRFYVLNPKVELGARDKVSM
jgi:hypothetical protein